MKLGSILQERYRIERLLAEGTHGQVYLGTHLDLGTELVVKVLKSGEERLLKEGRVLSRLRSPHTVRVLDFGRTDDGRPFLLLEHVNGESVASIISRRVLDSERVFHIISQVLDSLREAHAAGLVHGELSPAHVMVGVDDHTTVIEFGGAAEDRSPQQDLTAVGLLFRAMLPDDNFEPDQKLAHWLKRILGYDAPAFENADVARAALLQAIAPTHRGDEIVGTVVGGRYAVRELIERRSEGAVYRVSLVGAPDNLAVLRTRPDLPPDATTQSQFRATIRALTELRHPNINRTLDYGYLDDGTPYYVESLSTGGSLFRALSNGGVGEDVAIAIVRDLAEALHFASRRGWVHRALSPETVHLPDRPAAVTARLGGFALSALADLVGGDIPDPRVAAPEILRGEHVTPSADIYSLGLLAASCIGEPVPVWVVGNPTPLHLSEQPWELTRARQTSPALVGVIERCLAKSTDERFATAGELLEALEHLSTREVSAPNVLPQPGAVLDGRYELDSVLGSGGFARVFRANDRTTGDTVAVKVLHAHMATEADRRRFEREGQLVFTHLENRHTLQVIDYGVSRGGHCFITTEFIDGETLDAVLAKQGPMSAPHVAAIMLQVLASLQEAHDLRVFHRDIKPQNIMLSPRPYHGAGGVVTDAWVTVLDFGIASMQGELHDATSLTLTGTACGTARYMAPEQMFGHPVGPETDIYSLGLVAFELLTGAKAIKGTSNGEIVTNQVAPQSAILPADVDVPVDLRMIINKMMRKDRTTRFDSTRDVQRMLNRAKL